MTGPIRVDAVLTGVVAPLAGVPSAIVKRPRAGRVRLGREGLEGDTQADRRHHGGADKALHHYPFDHYAAWQADVGPLPLLDQAGAFGENLSSTGLVERDVAYGDTFRLGTAVIAVSQGRQPCFKLNLRFGVADMSLRVQENGRTGWYYRVVQEGEVKAGDTLVLLDRPHESWTIERMRRLLYVDPLNRGELAGLLALPELPSSWEGMARRRIDSGLVEDWELRLWGADGRPAARRG